MTDITGTSELTIKKVAAANIYKITYQVPTTIDICNNTNGPIYVNSVGAFSETGNVGNYLTVPEGGSYNGFRPAEGASIYINATAEGEICVIKKRY